MTKQETTPSQPTGRIPIEVQRTDPDLCIKLDKAYLCPVWRGDNIAWYDIYSLENGHWLGRQETFKECEEWLSLKEK